MEAELLRPGRVDGDAMMMLIEVNMYKRLCIDCVVGTIQAHLATVSFSPHNFMR